MMGRLERNTHQLRQTRERKRENKRWWVVEHTELTTMGDSPHDVGFTFHADCPKQSGYEL